MGWVSEPHKCYLPLICHGSVAKIGAIFECEQCYRSWKVIGLEPTHVESFYYLEFESRRGDLITVRSLAPNERVKNEPT